MLLIWPFSNVLCLGESSSKAIPLHEFLDRFSNLAIEENLLISNHHHQGLLGHTDFLNHIHDLSNPPVSISYRV